MVKDKTYISQFEILKKIRYIMQIDVLQFRDKVSIVATLIQPFFCLVGRANIASLFVIVRGRNVGGIYRNCCIEFIGQLQIESVIDDQHLLFLNNTKILKTFF